MERPLIAIIAVILGLVLKGNGQVPDGGKDFKMTEVAAQEQFIGDLNVLQEESRELSSLTPTVVAQAAKIKFSTGCDESHNGEPDQCSN